ncbi:hypothetical protein MKZ38_000501 [Zalerion maritima]|uniref:Uncharacterized protein n=1 Tax=Zalerion maritima TaxID=339359 RepID=A0AAD5RRH3_9PEZI|nr:hypothetical protein MKZ38_000501 [Zalerion maritima]
MSAAEQSETTTLKEAVEQFLKSWTPPTVPNMDIWHTVEPTGQTLRIKMGASNRQDVFLLKVFAEKQHQGRDLQDILVTELRARIPGRFNQELESMNVEVEILAKDNAPC